MLTNIKINGKMLVRESISFERGVDPKKQLGIGVDLTNVSEIKVNNFFPENRHTNQIQTLINNGYDIRIKFESEVMKKIYDSLKDKLVLFLQNDGITSLLNNKSYWLGFNSDNVPKNDIYIVNGFSYTTGRYDIDSTNTWSMSDSEKAFAKTLYKGRNNKEYHFFFNNSHEEISFVISKSEKFISLVIEGPVREKDIIEIEGYGFRKIPRYSDYYLGRWMKIDEVIDFVKNMNL
jgi:hypothetical protein